MDEPADESLDPELPGIDLEPPAPEARDAGRSGFEPGVPILPLPTGVGAPALGAGDGASGRARLLDPGPAAALELETDGGATFAVTLRGFVRQEDLAAARLGELLGLDPLTVESLLASVPVVVKRGASWTTAQQLERALRGIGADVDIQPEAKAERVAPSASIERARRAIASQNAAAAQQLPLAAVQLGGEGLAGPAVAGPGPNPSSQDHPGFAARLPVAFVVPLLGGGALWLAALTAAALLEVLFVGVVPCVGWLELPLFVTLYLALLGSYFVQAVRAGLEDTGERWPRPRWAPPAREELMERGGPVLLLAAVLFALPLLSLLAGHRPAAVVVAFALALAYWPMALTTVGLTGSVWVGVHPLSVLQGIRAAGLPYLVVVAIGLVAAAALGSMAWVSLAAGPVPAALGAVLVAFGVAYVSGVQGYLMGCLVASRFDDFEDLIR